MHGHGIGAGETLRIPIPLGLMDSISFHKQQGNFYCSSHSTTKGSFCSTATFQFPWR